MKVSPGDVFYVGAAHFSFPALIRSIIAVDDCNDRVLAFSILAHYPYYPSHTHSVRRTWIGWTTLSDIIESFAFDFERSKDPKKSTMRKL